MKNKLSGWEFKKIFKQIQAIESEHSMYEYYYYHTDDEEEKKEVEYYMDACDYEISQYVYKLRNAELTPYIRKTYEDVIDYLISNY